MQNVSIEEMERAKGGRSFGGSPDRLWHVDHVRRGRRLGCRPMGVTGCGVAALIAETFAILS
jgi:hypothetical protein